MSVSALIAPDKCRSRQHAGPINSAKSASSLHYQIEVMVDGCPVGVKGNDVVQAEVLVAAGGAV